MTSDVSQPNNCLLQLPPSLLHSILAGLLQQDPKALCTLLCCSKALASAACTAALNVRSFSSKGNAAFLTKQQQAVSPVALQHMLSALPNLQQLDLDHAYGSVDDGVLLSIAKHCKQLTQLQLRACQKISAVGLQVRSTSSSTGMEQQRFDSDIGISWHTSLHIACHAALHLNCCDAATVVVDAAAVMHATVSKVSMVYMS